MEIGAGMNFAIITKFVPATLRLLETFQPPNGFRGDADTSKAADVHSLD